MCSRVLPPRSSSPRRRVSDGRRNAIRGGRGHRRHQRDAARRRHAEANLSKEELTLLVKEAAEGRTVDRDAGEIAARAFDFGKLSARDVMVARSQALFLDLRSDEATIRDMLIEHRHQRYPVYDGTVDNIVGYIRTVDIVARVIDRKSVV